MEPDERGTTDYEKGLVGSSVPEGAARGGLRLPRLDSIPPATPLTISGSGISPGRLEGIRLYGYLPLGLLGGDTSLVNSLATPTTRLDRLADVIHQKMERTGADYEQQLSQRDERGSYWRLRAKYDFLFGLPPRPPGKFPREYFWSPLRPWRAITQHDVRACVFAAALLFLRSGEYVSPAVLMALWVREGKIRRNHYYHRCAVLRGFPSLRFFNQLLGQLEASGHVPPGLENEMKDYTSGIRLTFDAINDDVPRYRWWAWSHTMPHFWSLDDTVLRLRHIDNQAKRGEIPIPPSRHGRNIENHFRRWLQSLREVGAIASNADIESILAYSSTRGGGYQVWPDSARQEWPIRIRAERTNGGLDCTEAYRVVPLHLYLMGAFYLRQKHTIATEGGVRRSDVPDSAAYAAYNAGPSAVTRGRSKTDLQPESLRERWEQTPLTGRLYRWFLDRASGTNRLQSRGSLHPALRSPATNVRRFLFELEIFEGMMAVPRM